MDCPVCCEKITKRNVEVKCGFCDYSCCRDCFQNYILSKPVIPSCMNCNHEFNNQFLMNVCTKTFLSKDYKKTKEQFLYDREQIRFPEAQQLIIVRKSRDIAHQEAMELKRMYEEKMDEYYRLQTQFNQRDTTHMESMGSGYTRRCPMDNCRGFLNRQWKCGMCDKNICSKCNEEKVDEHECNPASVATAELIKKDSRPCPSCGMYIYKLEGCNQMWCTECSTAFDWKSGTIVTGNIHNPHFFEARRATGLRTRNINDVPCGGLPTFHDLTMAGFSATRYRFPGCIIDLVCDIQGKILNVREPNNIDLRIKFLEGKIDETAFKRAICMADKKYHQQREIEDVYQMVSTTLSDILRQLVIPNSGMVRNMAEQQIVDILNYANDAIRTITKKYGSKTDRTIYFGYKILESRYSSRKDLQIVYKRKEWLQRADEFRFEVGKTFVPPTI